MRSRLSVKVFVYLLGVSFLIILNGFRGMTAEAGDKGLLIGQMISRGEVRFEARGNVWKPVEPSAFPLFKGTRIKTEKGIALILLPDVGEIRVGRNSLFSYDRKGDFLLSQGSMNFRIRKDAEIRFEIGRLSVVPSRAFQASRNPSSVPSKDGEITGSISIHSDGGVTVKTLQGSVTVINQGETVLATLSSNQEIAIPSVSVKSGAGMMVARAGEPAAAKSETTEFLGLAAGDWIGLGVATIGVGVLTTAIYKNETRSDDDPAPVCP